MHLGRALISINLWVNLRFGGPPIHAHLCVGSGASVMLIILRRDVPHSRFKMGLTALK